jgi:hypothetical protein
MDTYRAAITHETPAQVPHGSPAVMRSAGADRDLVCAPLRHCLGNTALGNGLRLGDDLLAPDQGLAEGASPEPAAPGAAVQAARSGQAGFLSRCG